MALVEMELNSNQTNIRRRRFKDLLRGNELGIVDNPLYYRSPDNLQHDVQTFLATHGLGDVVDFATLLRGARLAQDPGSVNDLSVVERAALLREEDPKIFEQSKELQVVLLTCCIGAIVQGWSQANIVGANLLWPGEFHLSVDVSGGKKGDIWIFGAVNGITYFAASLIGAWCSDPLNEHLYGRRGALFVAGLFSFAASVGSYFVHSWQSLFICRLLQGIGMGAKASVVPILESEVSPSRIRGRILVSWQTFTAIGIFLGSAVSVIVHNNWRLQIVSGFIPAVPLLCLTFVCSESPRWLIKKNRYSQAYQVLRRLRDTPLQAARDLYNIHAQIQVETILFSERDNIERELQDWSGDANNDMYQREVRTTNYWQRLMQLFYISRNRRASLAACIAMISQQFSGINIFAFLATTVFKDAGYTDMQSLWYSFGFAAANALFSPVAYWYIDRKGRRFLLLVSLVVMVPLLLATGFSFQIPNSHERPRVVAAFLIIYTAVYSPGAGVVPFLYSSEVFPLVNREAGMSLACSINFFLAGVIALVVRQFSHSFGNTRLLALFAGLDAFAAILVWLFLPGTTEVTSLEDMNYIFGVPTKRHVRYQVGTVLVWAVTSYVPWLLTQYLPWLASDYALWKARHDIPWLLKQYFQWLGDHLIRRDDQSDRPTLQVERPRLQVEEPTPPRLVALYRWNRLQNEQQEQRRVPEAEPIDQPQEQPTPL